MEVFTEMGLRLYIIWLMGKIYRLQDAFIEADLRAKGYDVFKGLRSDTMGRVLGWCPPQLPLGVPLLIELNGFVSLFDNPSE